MCKIVFITHGNNIGTEYPDFLRLGPQTLGFYVFIKRLHSNEAL